MDCISQPDKDEILRLLGSIVFASQVAELSMKSFLPLVEQKPKKSIAGKGGLKKHTLGDLAGVLSSAFSGDKDLIVQLKSELARVVKDRNRVTHHFLETYQNDLSAGNAGPVIESLQSILHNTSAFGSVMNSLRAKVHEARIASEQNEHCVAQVVLCVGNCVAS